jgi:U3 small nucleolar ribonucleoprotein protein IMP4
MLAKFMNWEYISRGKSGMKDLPERIAIVEEINGNPSILKILQPKGTFHLRFNVGGVQKIKMDDSPVIFVGKPPFNPLIIGAIPSEISRNFESKKKIFVKKSGELVILDFRYNEKSIFKLKLVSNSER